jgi:hypothetical protein
MEKRFVTPTSETIKTEISDLILREKERLSPLIKIDMNEVILRVYNNWPQRLPGGIYQTRYLPVLGENSLQRDQEGASELYVNQTLGQYIQTINSTIHEFGGEKLMQEMFRLNLLANNTLPGADFKQYSLELEKIAEPVYIALRCKGYNHADLTR